MQLYYKDNNEMKIPKLLIVGMGRHGKDTVAEILRDRCGMEFSSSSFAAYEIFIYDLFKEKYGYTSIEEAYEDRHNHREELFKLIQDYNSEDRTRLARGIVNSTGMYVGMRCALEVEACIEKAVFDLIIWVDASERIDYVEPSSSISVTKEHADIVLTNNGTLEQLEAKVVKLADAIGLYVR